jgi:hypothetical protein
MVSMQERIRQAERRLNEVKMTEKERYRLERQIESWKKTNIKIEKPKRIRRKKKWQ